MDRTVDLRSDTITRPTEAMWEAMHHADVGDDVYGEDPTVNRLQELAAERTGMEAGLFLPTGTMANTSALLAHTQHGDEIVVEELAHLFCWEAGAYSNIAGLATRSVRGEDGIFTADQFEAVLRPPNPHFPRTSLLCLENSHNNAAGAVWSVEETAAVARVAHARDLMIHLDGARVFNAAVALGVDVKELTRHVDSVTFCVSKGLSAPVGSVLCGTRAFIDEAYRARKRLGGAMRQAGIMAAAGIVAIETMVDRLADDHDTARGLAEGLGAIEGITAKRAPRPTNILMVNVGELGWSSADLIERWLAHGIKCNPRPPSGVRMVTNRHVSADDVQYVLDVTRDMVQRDAVAAGG
jgi:threonine aldolase